MSERRSLWRGVCWSFLLSLVLAHLGLGVGYGASLQVRADPDRLPADGKSQAVIIAEVTGANGLPLPDGTPVTFITTLGKIVSPVQSVGGLAQTSFTASRTAGTARISAVAGGTRRTVEVELTALPGSTSQGARMVELTADEVAYCGERCLFVATWNVKLTQGGLTLQADGLQYEVDSNAIRAQGNVVLKSGGKELHADALSYDLLSLTGRLIRITDGGGEHLTVEGERLTTKPDTSADQALWDPVKTDDTRAWVKASRAIIDPGDKIILDHATFYVDDNKVLSLRRHVMPVQHTSALLGQIVGFSSVGGVSVDYPYYYRASAHDIGSISLRRNALNGNQWQPGWTLGLTEEYTREGKWEGSFDLNDLLHPSQGIRWEHRQHFGALSLDADYSSTAVQGGFYPSYRNAGLNLFHPLGTGSLSLALGTSTFSNSKEQFADLGYRFASFSLFKGLSATPTLHLRESTRQITSHDMVIDPLTGEPMTFDDTASGRSTTSGLDVAFGIRPLSVGPLKLTGSLSTGYSLNLANLTGVPLLSTRWTLDHHFREGSYLGLTANYSRGTAAFQSSLLRSAQKSVGLTGRTTVKKVTLGLNVNQGVGEDRRYGNFTCSTPLPFGKDAFGQPLWSFDALHVFSRFDTFRASSTVLSLNRSIGRYQASLKYSPEGAGTYGANRPWVSPTGFGYTYSGGRHLWLEFSAATD